MCCVRRRTRTRPHDEDQHYARNNAHQDLAGRGGITRRARLRLDLRSSSHSATRESLLSYRGTKRDYCRASTIPANLRNGAVPPDGINQSGEQEEEPQDQLGKDGPLHVSFRVSDCPANRTKFLFRHENLRSRGAA